VLLPDPIKEFNKEMNNEMNICENTKLKVLKTITTVASYMIEKFHSYDKKIVDHENIIKFK